MVAKNFVTQTNEGTITISTAKFDGKLYLLLHDSFNSFECRCELSHLADLKKLFKEASTMKGEMHSWELIKRISKDKNITWFYGNYIYCFRAKLYIKALEDIGKPTDYKVGSLKRMSTKHLMELYIQNNFRKVILQEKKGR